MEVATMVTAIIKFRAINVNVNDNDNSDNDDLFGAAGKRAITMTCLETFLWIMMMLMTLMLLL
jgi:hypothetical protein